MAGAYGLDFGAIASLATAMGVMSPLLAEVLPEYEAIVVQAMRTPGEDDSGDGGGED